MIIPKTSDGRVVFLVPWEDHVIMGTTDTPIQTITQEPIPLENEVEFLLKTGNEYLDTKLTKDDILSVFAGLRPLVSPQGNTDTKNISREAGESNRGCSKHARHSAHSGPTGHGQDDGHRGHIGAPQ